MAKAGFKLKELLINQKEQAKLNKLEEAKKNKTSEQLANDEPTVVSAEDVARAELVKEATVKDSGVKAEEYQSQALSKKEKRMLKKQMKQIEEVTKAEEADAAEEEDESEEEKRLDLDRLADSASDSDSDDEDVEEKIEEDIPLSDVEFDSDADIVPYHKLTINNTKAMQHALERVQLPWAKHSFQEHQSVTSKENTDASIKDIYDDTERELAFYKQSMDAVLESREHLKRLKVPFKRPLDYFAEMVKNDEHMDKIKGKLVKEASEKKARLEARKQRELKKFGKQVQVATLQKRQAEKRETLDKIKTLKKKRKQSEIGGDDFDVGIEEATEEPERKRSNSKRDAKNSKYGQGGMKRFKRKNDADSSMDVGGFSQKKMKGKPSRPGKSKRTRRH